MSWFARRFSWLWLTAIALSIGCSTVRPEVDSTAGGPGGGGSRDTGGDGGGIPNSMSAGAAGGPASNLGGIGGTGGPGVWEAQVVPAAGDLAGIWGTSATNVFAVGAGGVILHFDGSTWRAMDSGTTSALTAVWGPSEANVYAVGADLTILSYDGVSWSKMPVTHPFTRTFNAIWGTSPSDLWAVGTGYLRMHYDGKSWTGSTNVLTDWLASVWGYGAGNLLAVGNFGATYRYENGQWIEGEAFSAPGTVDNTYVGALYTDLRAVWSPDGANVFLAGDYDENGFADGDNSGAVFKFDTATHELGFLWRDAAPDLRAIAGTSSTDVWVVGLRGTLAHFDGKEFRKVSAPTTRDLLSVWVTSTDAFAVGRFGTLLHAKF